MISALARFSGWNRHRSGLLLPGMTFGQMGPACCCEEETYPCTVLCAAAPNIIHVSLASGWTDKGDCSFCDLSTDFAVPYSAFLSNETRCVWYLLVEPAPDCSESGGYTISLTYDSTVSKWYGGITISGGGFGTSHYGSQDTADFESATLNNCWPGTAISLPNTYNYHSANSYCSGTAGTMSIY